MSNISSIRWADFPPSASKYIRIMPPGKLLCEDKKRLTVRKLRTVSLFCVSIRIASQVSLIAVCHAEIGLQTFGCVLFRLGQELVCLLRELLV